jgi:DNA-directed RNA polymerase subunit RPC12/RpoP
MDELTEKEKELLQEEEMLPYNCINCGIGSETPRCDICTETLGILDLTPRIIERRGELPHSRIKSFVLGGNSIFTLWNTVRDTHLTYKVKVAVDNDELFFVSVLTGPDNWANYTYLGIIRNGVYWHGRNSKISRDSISAKTFEWFWNNLTRLPTALKVLHEGKCGRCGRKLTVPESIESGFGPECIKLVG